MAAPHVAGVVALILSAEPRLAGHVDLIEQIIRDSAEQLTSTQNCGDYPGNQVPNAVFNSDSTSSLGSSHNSSVQVF